MSSSLDGLLGSVCCQISATKAHLSVPPPLCLIPCRKFIISPFLIIIDSGSLSSGPITTMQSSLRQRQISARRKWYCQEFFCPGSKARILGCNGREESIPSRLTPL